MHGKKKKIQEEMGEFKGIEGREAKIWEGKEKREIESWEEIQAEIRRVRNRTKNTGKRRLNGDVLENRRKKILNENCFTLIFLIGRRK